MAEASISLAQRLKDSWAAKGKDETQPLEQEEETPAPRFGQPATLADQMRLRLHDRAAAPPSAAKSDRSASPAVPPVGGEIMSVLRKGVAFGSATAPASTPSPRPPAARVGTSILKRPSDERGTPRGRAPVISGSKLKPEKVEAVDPPPGRLTPVEVTAAAARKQATELAKFLTAHGVPLLCESGAAKRLDKAKSRPDDEAFVDRLVVLGGKNGEPSKQLRLFLTDWRAYLELPPANSDLSLFPLDSASVSELLFWLKSEGKVAAVARVPAAMAFAQKLGYEVEIDESFLAVDWGARKPQGAEARAPLTPLACVLLERAAKGPWPADGQPEPSPDQFYAIQAWMMVMGTERPADAWHSVYTQSSYVRETGEPDGVVQRECCNDKLQRTGVVQWTLSEGFEEEILSFPQAFATLMSGTKYRFPAFEYAPNKGLYADAKSATGWRDGSVKRAGTISRVAAAAVATTTLSHVTGMSVDELKIAKWSGTNWPRHTAPDITSMRWPTDEQAVFGDWTPTKTAVTGQGANTKSREKRSTKKSASMPRRYAPNASRSDQIRVRTRWIRMARYFLEKYEGGIEGLSIDTPWSDVIPMSAECEGDQIFFGSIDDKVFPEGFFSARVGEQPFTKPKRQRTPSARAAPPPGKAQRPRGR